MVHKVEFKKNEFVMVKGLAQARAISDAFGWAFTDTERLDKNAKIRKGYYQVYNPKLKRWY